MMLTNSFHEARYKNWIRTQEKKTTISLTNVDAEILNKTFANRIPQHLKKIIYHNQVGFIPGVHVCSTYANQ
jgi:glycine cleavage system H lipoate-binding protein